MDTSLLSSRCIELLRSHNRVSLGNMGSFMAEDTPATFTHESHVLMPPGRRISFRESETWNDGLLEKSYDSPEELDELITEISRKLAKEKSVTLDGFGKLRRTREGDIFFVMDKNVSINPNGFGLVPLSLSPLPTPSKLQCDLSIPANTQAVINTIKDRSSVPDDNKAPDVPVAENPVLERKRKTRKKNTSQWLWGLLTIVLCIILTAFLIYVFRDSLRPILQKILYSPEERLLL